MNKTDYISHYETIANKIADLIEKNEAPWQKTWVGGAGYLPYNIKTGKEYQGINIFTLMDTHYSDPRWLTFKQANELGGRVSAGEKGQKVLYFQTTEKVTEVDRNGNEIEREVLLERPKAFWSIVFNAEQCENIPQLDFKTKKHDWQPIDKAQEVIDKTGAIIKHTMSNKAFYSIAGDTINLPLKEQFPKAEDYYRTALHELGHWTGHENRLNRTLDGNKRSEKYAKEELIAEITSFMTGSYTGLGHEPDPNTVSYLKTWSQAIRSDPKYLVKACQEADKASKFLLGDLKKELNQSRENITMANINEVDNKRETENLERVYINVPRAEKDEAKIFGAKWDKNVQSWFVPNGIDINMFKKWEQTNPINLAIATPDKFFIAVPYTEKDQAKALGAKWDKENQSWYCKPDDKEKFNKWFVQNTVDIKTDIPIDPRSEFLAVMKECGVNENELIADGNKHRIAVDGDKNGEKAGFYVLHTDGVPNGYFCNNRTGEEIKWVQKGYVLSNAEKENLKITANAKNAERKQQEAIAEQKAIDKLKIYFSTAKGVENSAYLEKKEIKPTKNIFVSPMGDIAIPLTNINGDIVSAQYITSDGLKRFAHDTKRSGAFHVIDGNLKDLTDAKTVILAEGYSTANTIHICLNKSVPVIATFGAANIENTVGVLQEKFPDLKIIIGVDNDLSNAKKGLQNVGLIAGQKATEKYTNVTCVIPKLNNKVFDGDFNDLFVKQENKTDAMKSIANLFKKELKQEKRQDKEINRDKGLKKA